MPSVKDAMKKSNEAQIVVKMVGEVYGLVSHWETILAGILGGKLAVSVRISNVLAMLDYVRTMCIIERITDIYHVKSHSRFICWCRIKLIL